MFSVCVFHNPGQENLMNTLNCGHESTSANANFKQCPCCRGFILEARERAKRIRRERPRRRRPQDKPLRHNPFAGLTLREDN